jgi:hypothetical protein
MRGGQYVRGLPVSVSKAAYPRRPWSSGEVVREWLQGLPSRSACVRDQTKGGIARLLI